MHELRKQPAGPQSLVVIGGVPILEVCSLQPAVLEEEGLVHDLEQGTAGGDLEITG